MHLWYTNGWVNLSGLKCNTSGFIAFDRLRRESTKENNDSGRVCAHAHVSVWARYTKICGRVLTKFSSRQRTGRGQKCSNIEYPHLRGMAQGVYKFYAFHYGCIECGFALFGRVRLWIITQKWMQQNTRQQHDYDQRWSLFKNINVTPCQESANLCHAQH